MKKRTTYSSDFKKKVVLEALKERKTLQEISTEYDVSPSQVTRWKEELLEGSSSLFDRGSSKEVLQVKELEKEKSSLHQKIGQLTVEVDFLKKKLNQLG